MPTLEIDEEFLDRVENFLNELKKQKEDFEAYEKNSAKIEDFWNANLDEINKNISENMDFDKWLNETGFKWQQLVWQEIDMWARINRPVYKKEFEIICERRGFNNKQKDFLVEALRLAGLDKTDIATKKDLKEVAEQLEKIPNSQNG